MSIILLVTWIALDQKDPFPLWGCNRQVLSSKNISISSKRVKLEYSYCFFIFVSNCIFTTQVKGCDEHFF